MGNENFDELERIEDGNDIIFRRRVAVVRLWCKGHTRKQIVAMTYYSYPSVARFIKLYTKSGAKALEPRRMGRPPKLGRI